MYVIMFVLTVKVMVWSYYEWALVGSGRGSVELLPLCYKISFVVESRETIKLCVAEGFVIDVSYLERD